MRNLKNGALILAMLLSACNGGSNRSATLQNSFQITLPKLNSGEELEYINISAKNADSGDTITDFTCQKDKCSVLEQDATGYKISFDTAGQKCQVAVSAVTAIQDGGDGVTDAIYAFSGESSEPCVPGQLCDVAITGRSKVIRAYPRFRALADEAGSGKKANFKAASNEQVGSEDITEEPGNAEDISADNTSGAQLIITLPVAGPGGSKIPLSLPFAAKIEDSHLSWDAILPREVAMRVSVEIDNKKAYIVKNDGNNNDSASDIHCTDLLISDSSLNESELNEVAQLLGLENKDPNCTISLNEFSSFGPCLELAPISGCLLSNDQISALPLTRDAWELCTDNAAYFKDILQKYAEDDEFKKLKNFRGLPDWKVSGILHKQERGANISCHYSLNIDANGLTDYLLYPPKHALEKAISTKVQNVVQQILAADDGFYILEDAFSDISNMLEKDSNMVEYLGTRIIKIPLVTQTDGSTEIDFAATGVVLDNAALEDKSEIHDPLKLRRLDLIGGSVGLLYENNCTNETTDDATNISCKYIPLSGNDKGNFVNINFNEDSDSNSDFGTLGLTNTIMAAIRGEESPIPTTSFSTVLGKIFNGGIFGSIFGNNNGMTSGPTEPPEFLQDFNNLQGNFNLLNFGNKGLILTNDHAVHQIGNDGQERSITFAQYSCEGNEEYEASFDNVVIGPDGFAYAADFLGNTIWRSQESIFAEPVAPEGEEEEEENRCLAMEPFIENLIEPYSLAIKNGLMLVASSALTGNFLTIDTESKVVNKLNEIKQSATENVLVNPTSLLLQPNNRLLIADTTLGVVKQVSVDNGELTKTVGSVLAPRLNGSEAKASEVNLGEIVDIKAASGDDFYLGTMLNYRYVFDRSIYAPRSLIYEYQSSSESLKPVAGNTDGYTDITKYADYRWEIEADSINPKAKELIINRPLFKLPLINDLSASDNDNEYYGYIPNEKREWRNTHISLAHLQGEAFFDTSPQPYAEGNDAGYYGTTAGALYKMPPDNFVSVAPLGVNVTMNDGVSDVIIAYLANTYNNTLACGVVNNNNHTIYWHHYDYYTDEISNTTSNLQINDYYTNLQDVRAIATNGSNTLYLALEINTTSADGHGTDDFSRKVVNLFKVTFMPYNDGSGRLNICDPTEVFEEGTDGDGTDGEGDANSDTPPRPKLENLNYELPDDLTALAYVPENETHPELLCYSQNSTANGQVRCLVLGNLNK